MEAILRQVHRHGGYGGRARYVREQLAAGRDPRDLASELDEGHHAISNEDLKRMAGRDDSAPCVRVGATAAARPTLGRTSQIRMASRTGPQGEFDLS